MWQASATAVHRSAGQGAWRWSAGQRSMASTTARLARSKRSTNSRIWVSIRTPPAVPRPTGTGPGRPEAARLAPERRARGRGAVRFGGPGDRCLQVRPVRLVDLVVGGDQPGRLGKGRGVGEPEGQVGLDLRSRQAPARDVDVE